jgi:hypothetical protein
MNIILRKHNLEIVKMNMQRNKIMEFIQDDDFLSNKNIDKILSYWNIIKEEAENDDPEWLNKIGIFPDKEKSYGLMIIDINSMNIFIGYNSMRWANWHTEQRTDIWIRTIGQIEIENSYINKFITEVNDGSWDRIIGLFMNNRIKGALKDNECNKPKKIPEMNEYETISYLKNKMYGIIKNEFVNNIITAKQFTKLNKEIEKTEFYEINFEPFTIKTFEFDNPDHLYGLLITKNMISEIENLGIKMTKDEKWNFLY